MNLKIPSNASYFSSLLIGIAQFDIVPEEYLNYMYVWKYFDGDYLEDREEEDERRL